MKQIETRQIRMFISSTFEDMKNERDYLIKKVFPELRQKAFERDVTLIDVDLRWGITEEQSKKGQVIDICFNEIDNSIPFFIGIVGNRYGWRPEESDVDTDTCTHFESIKKYIDRHLSATEMEIQYGVLERKQKMYASFYIDSRLVDENQIDYPDQLKDLKNKIRNNKRYPYDEYFSKESLGEKVKNRFIELLDNLFPIGEKLSEAERIVLSQRINMNRLCSIYIPEERRFNIIDTFLRKQDKNQLIISGVSGVGKSAFVAEWVRRNQSHKNIIYYSVGCGGNNSDKDTVLNHLALLINHKHNNQDGSNNDVYLALKTYAEANEELVVVLDGFNQIELEEKDENLEWFPKPQGNTKFIITIANDRDEYHFNPTHLNTKPVLLSRKHSEEFVFRDLSESKRKKLINTFLSKHGKTLDTVIVDEIASKKLFHNNLALRILLDELIIYPKHETIKKKIKEYLNSKSIESFIVSVINRYEQDYGYILVKKTLSLLSISKMGFDERELRDLINVDLRYSYDNLSKNHIITTIEWSQFFNAFKDNLSTREGGLLGFAHQIVKDVIVDKYVSNEDEMVTSLRKLIIDTLKSEKSPRAYLELRHQYQELGMYEQLHALITNIDVFFYLIKNHWGALCESWEELCIYISNPYPLADIISTWKKLTFENKAKTYKDTEFMLMAIITDQQGHWPPDPCPEEFAYMQELCIPYQKENYGLFYYNYSAGLVYAIMPDKMEHGLSLLLNAAKTIEAFDSKKWHEYYDEFEYCYSEIARCYNVKNNKAEEIRYLKLIVKLSEDYNGIYHSKTQFWYYQVGYACFVNRGYNEAIDNLIISLNIADKLQDNDAVFNVCNGLIQCYEAAFKKDEQDNSNLFFNKDNYIKYLNYNERMAAALKEQGNIMAYKTIMKKIEVAKKESDL